MQSIAIEKGRAPPNAQNSGSLAAGAGPALPMRLPANQKQAKTPMFFRNLTTT
jgi:hypothetical protein